MNSNLFDGVVPGMTVKIHQKIKEMNPKGEEKERIQVFEGIVLQRRGGMTNGATITVRKMSHGVSVEKIFPLYLPSITKVDKIKQAPTQRAKLFYLRSSKKKLKEKALS
ncbi:MAG: 50S ribosomal protein L19 [Patescibacteria group bacterium]